MFGRKKKNYKVIIVRKTDKRNFQKIDEKKVSVKDEKISYEEKTVPLKDIYMYNDGKTSYAFWDYDNNSFIQLHNKPLLVNAKFLDKFLTTSKVGIIGQLLSVIKTDMKEKKTDWGALGKPIIIFILGAVIGYFIGGGSVGI